jgi:hypothetical protein
MPTQGERSYGNLYKFCYLMTHMKSGQPFLEKIFWGVFFVVAAAALVVVWVTGSSIFVVIPLVFLGMGLWMVGTGASFYNRAWGIVVALIGALWLLRGYFSLSLYIVAAGFLVVVGVLVIVGART